MASNQSLDSISVKGFKSIASIEKFPLRAINFLIGSNGSGKSNFIGAFEFLKEVREGRLQEYVRRLGGAEQLLHFGSKQTKEIELHVSFNQQVNQYKILLRPNENDSLYPALEQVYFWDKSRYKSPYDDSLSSRAKGLEAGISEPNLTKTAGWVQHRLGAWRVYHVHDTSSTSPMRKTAKLNDNIFLRTDGSNLAAFLFRLKQQFPEAYQLIRRTIQLIAPFFDDFALTADRLQEESIRLEWKHKHSDQYFGPSSLSDGSLRFIALATLFLQPSELRPSIILVDEPELGLHPAAIEMLASLIKQASTSTQVILSTQSSLLLDHFSPEDVIVTEREGGGTSLHRLDANSLNAWLEDYSLGQLWEKNELGGRPSLEN